MRERFNAMCTMELRAYRDYYYEQIAIIADWDRTGIGTARLESYISYIENILKERGNDD